MAYPDGTLLEYAAHDQLDRPELVYFGGATLAHLSYAGQRLVRIELYSTVDHTPLPATDELTLALDVGHDEYGRTTDYLWRGALTEAIDWFATERDENGNPKYEWADLLPSTLPRPFGKHWSFLADGVDRLMQAKSGNTIDASGNITGTPRVTMTWTLDDLGARTGFVDNTGTHVGTFNSTNQMVTDVVGTRTATLVYDAAGNTLSIKQTNGVGYFYKYDVFNRLRQVYSLGTATVNSQGAVVSGTLGPLLATYVYDALGRRIHEVLSGVGSGSRRFLYGAAGALSDGDMAGSTGWQVLEERNPAAAGQPLTKRYFWGTQELDELWALDHYPEGQPPQRYLCTRDLRHNIRALVWYQPTGAGGGGFNGPSGAPGEGDGGAGAPPEGWAPDYGGYDAPPETLPVPDPEPPPDDEWPPPDEGGEGGTGFPPDGPGQMNAPSGGGSASPTVILERYLYKPYGERIAINPSNPGVVSGDDDPSTVEPFPTSPYGFQGLHHDVGTFRIYLRKRYYDAVLNRFLTHDPIGYADGMNVYEAFRSNPTRWVDPFGLFGNEATYDLRADRMQLRILREGEPEPGVFAQAWDETQITPIAEAIVGIHEERETGEPVSFDEMMQILFAEIPARQMVAREVNVATAEGRQIDFSIPHITKTTLTKYGGWDATQDFCWSFSFTAGRPIHGIERATTGLYAVSQLSGTGATVLSVTEAIGTSLSGDMAQAGLLSRLSSGVQSGCDRLLIAYARRGPSLGTNFSFGPVSGDAAELLVAQFPAVSAEGEVNLLNVARRGVQLTSEEASAGMRFPGIGPETNRRFVSTLWKPIISGARLHGRGVGKLGDFVTRSYTLNEAGLAEFFGAVPSFEAPVAAPLGGGTTRYLDLQLRDFAGTQHIQFIRLESGHIPPREIRAAIEIQQRTGEPVFFIVTGQR